MINFKEFGSPYASEQWRVAQHDLAFSYDPVNGVNKNYSHESGGSTNVIVPNLPGCVKIGDKVLKYNGADISNLDSRYVFGNAVCFKVGSTESKFISARPGGGAAWAPNLSTTSGQYSYSPTPSGVPSTTEHDVDDAWGYWGSDGDSYCVNKRKTHCHVRPIINL